MKRTAGTVTRLLFVGSLAAVPRVALAEDFEFEVPVELSNIDPRVTQARVECTAFGFEGTGQQRRMTFVGSGITTFALQNGSYKDKVSVKFNADRTRNQPSAARTWTCTMDLILAGTPHSLCVLDHVTGQGTSQNPPLLKLDVKSIKGCTRGSIAPPPGSN
jgi:hypothetical protein